MQYNSINDDGKIISNLKYINLWFRWVSGNVINIVDMQNNILATCSDTRISWTDFKKYGPNLCINDYLCDKLNLFIKKGNSNSKLNTTIWCTFDGHECRNLKNSAATHIILYYIENLKTKEIFNIFDLELCGLILGGNSIYTNSKKFLPLDLPIKI